MTTSSSDALPAVGRSSSQIARTYYVIAGVYTLSASLIWGVNTIFLLRSGHLTLLEVFTANAIFTGSMAVFEVPTGIVADTRGRRFSFLCSVAVLLIGTLAYVGVPALGGRFVAFCVASVVLGLGYTFYSGAVEAWLVDALKASGDREPVDRVLARGQLVSSAAMLVGAVAGGLLASWSLAAPYLVRSALLLIAFVVGYVAMHDIGFDVRAFPMREVGAEMARIGRQSIRFGWNERRAQLAILAGAAPAVFLEWGYHAWQPYFLQLVGSGAIWILGWIAAAIAVAMMLGNWLVERMTQFCGKRSTLLLGAGAVYAATAIGVGVANSFALALSLYLIGMMSAGVFQPVRQAYLHQVVPSEQRATVLSLASLVSSTGSMLGQGGLGWVAARTSLATGYVVGGALTALAIPPVLAIRRLGGVADLILGKAGRYTACATLALPEGVAVSAQRDVEVVASKPIERGPQAA
ncbi:MAG TPA: MFS transporter [Gemmatimonadaceae bacterium]|nr:MFS transporter [Gemmatimonadaceae bacterium]